MLPRHSPLRESYHMARPCFQLVSPDLRYCSVQPAEPGFDGGLQYRPSDSNVAIALVLVEGRVSTGGEVGVGWLVGGGLVGSLEGGGVLVLTRESTILS